MSAGRLLNMYFDNRPLCDFLIYNLEVNSTTSQTLSITAYLLVRTSFLSIHIDKNKKLE